MKNQSRQENLIYLVVWGLLFAAPLLSLYVRTVNDPDIAFNWTEVFLVWRKFGIFLLLFLVHNFLLAPLLVHQHRRTLYLSVVIAVMAGLAVYQYNERPMERKHLNPGRPPMEMQGDAPDDMGRPDDMEMPDGMEIRGERPPKPEDFGGPRMRGHHQPPVVIGEHHILSIVVLLLMFGANLGIKFYYRSRSDQRKLQEMEKQNLEQQLEYLKYQINPHFFMNTLNNIHALVDIDPTKAQETILELSKMMRFVLYEGNKNGVPLTKEFEFIRTYTKLMQLRYTDKVKITVDVPEEAPDKTIPPLMLISFIENAFKHGISYQHDSFIDIKVELSSSPSWTNQAAKPSAHLLTFICKNSKAERPNQEKGGVGLTNVKKRLDLLYDHNYTLKIEDEPATYFVKLMIPLS